MRDPSLRAALASFVEEAGWQLASEVAGGADLPFDLAPVQPGGRRRSGAPLYCYRPLTGRFIDDRLPTLHRLPAYPPALRALAGVQGMDAYLRARGRRRVPHSRAEQAEATLRELLEAMWSGTGEFSFDGARFDALYAELEATAWADRTVDRVVAPVRGVELESDEVVIDGELSLRRAETFPDAPPELELAPGVVLAVRRAERPVNSSGGFERAGIELRRLQGALRLWHGPDAAVGPLAWARVDEGPWHLATLHSGARRAGDRALITEADEDQLRAFCSLVARRTPRAGELAWALRRYELGCERAAPLEALSDWLLALRALFEPEGPGSGDLVPRLSAICAGAEQRGDFAARLAQAIAVERGAIAGVVRAEPEVCELVDEVGAHLQAVLRDVLCGHLDPDLRGLADRLRDEGAPTGEHETVSGPG